MDRLLTYKEVAEKLGIGPGDVICLVNRRMIPFTVKQNLLLFSEREIKKWFNNDGLQKAKRKLTRRTKVIPGTFLSDTEAEMILLRDLIGYFGSAILSDTELRVIAVLQVLERPGGFNEESFISKMQSLRQNLCRARKKLHPKRKSNQHQSKQIPHKNGTGYNTETELPFHRSMMTMLLLEIRLFLGPSCMGRVEDAYRKFGTSKDGEIGVLRSCYRRLKELEKWWNNRELLKRECVRILQELRPNTPLQEIEEGFDETFDAIDQEKRQAETIKQLRESRGLSLEKFAERSGIPSSTLQAIEASGKIWLADSHGGLEKIAEGLGMEPQMIMEKLGLPKNN